MTLYPSVTINRHGTSIFSNVWSSKQKRIPQRPTDRQKKTTYRSIMVERIKNFKEILMKSAMDRKKEQGEERLTIVLASYQEGQVHEFIKMHNCESNNCNCR